MDDEVLNLREDFDQIMQWIKQEQEAMDRIERYLAMERENHELTRNEFDQAKQRLEELERKHAEGQDSEDDGARFV